MELMAQIWFPYKFRDNFVGSIFFDTGEFILHHPVFVHSKFVFSAEYECFAEKIKHLLSCNCRIKIFAAYSYNIFKLCSRDFNTDFFGTFRIIGVPSGNAFAIVLAISGVTPASISFDL